MWSQHWGVEIGRSQQLSGQLVYLSWRVLRSEKPCLKETRWEKEQITWVALEGQGSRLFSNLHNHMHSCECTRAYIHTGLWVCTYMLSENARSSMLCIELRTDCKQTPLICATSHLVIYSFCLVALQITSWGWNSGNLGASLHLTFPGDLERVISHFWPSPASQSIDLGWGCQPAFWGHWQRTSEVMTTWDSQKESFIKACSWAFRFKTQPRV